MLPSYIDYSFVHLLQKVRLRPELSPKFWSTLGPNPARTRARPEKPGLTYKPEAAFWHKLLRFSKKNFPNLATFTAVSIITSTTIPSAG